MDQKESNDIMEELEEHIEMNNYLNKAKNRVTALYLAVKLSPNQSFDMVVLASRAFENYLNEPIPDGQ